MEYTDGQRKEQYFTESGNIIRKMDKDISTRQMAMNIAETGRITCHRERQYSKRTEYCTETHMNKASA